MSKRRLYRRVSPEVLFKDIWGHVRS